MRAGRIGNAFEFIDFQNAKIGCPLMVSEQGVVISAEILRNTLGRNGCVEHSTQGHTIDITGVHANANDAPGQLVHDHEHPVGVEQNGLATKNISAPEAVFYMADKRQPGRAVTGAGSRSVVLFKHAPDKFFIDVDSERFVNLLRYSGTAKPRISSFHFDDGIYEFL